MISKWECPRGPESDVPPLLTCGLTHFPHPQTGSLKRRTISLNRPHISYILSKSLSTFAGLILSLIKESRESRKSDIEAQRMELELERTAIELAALRKQAGIEK
jgi:hypothetical protein